MHLPHDVKLCYYVSGIHHVIIFTSTASDDSCDGGLGTRIGMVFFILY